MFLSSKFIPFSLPTVALSLGKVNRLLLLYSICKLLSSDFSKKSVKKHIFLVFDDFFASFEICNIQKWVFLQEFLQKLILMTARKTRTSPHSVQNLWKTLWRMWKSLVETRLFACGNRKDPQKETKNKRPTLKTDDLYIIILKKNSFFSQKGVAKPKKV